MIICEECGARNRNGAYVCAECGAGLLHLEATQDDGTEPGIRKTPLMGRRKSNAPQHEDDGYEAEEADESGAYEPEADEADEAEPVKAKRPLFGRRTRPGGEPRFEDDGYEPEAADESGAYEPEAFEADESQPAKAKRPLFGRRTRFGVEPRFEDDGDKAEAADESGAYEPEAFEADEAEIVKTNKPLTGRKAEPEEEDEETAPNEELRFVWEDHETAAAGREPLQGGPEADTGPRDEPAGQPPAAETEPEGVPLSFELGEGSLKSSTNAERRPAFSEEGASESEAPASITIDMEVEVFDEEEEDDGGYHEEYEAAPVYTRDFKSAYRNSRRQSEGMTRGMVAAIITVSSLLVVTLIVLGVLLIGRNNRSAPVIATTAPAELAAPEAEAEPSPSPSAEPTPSQTPIPTTKAEDDYGSVFEQPTNALLPDTNSN